MGRESDGEAFARLCVCVCVCVHARVRMCICVRHIHSLTHSVTFVFVCAFEQSMTVFIPKPPLFRCAHSTPKKGRPWNKDCHRLPFSVCSVHLAALGAVGGGLASSTNVFLFLRLAAVVAQHGIAAATARCVLRPGHLVPLLVGTPVKLQAPWARSSRWGELPTGTPCPRRIRLRLPPCDGQVAKYLPQTKLQGTRREIQPREQLCTRYCRK
jgi:hypothetical protein